MELQKAVCDGSQLLPTKLLRSFGHEWEFASHGSGMLEMPGQTSYQTSIESMIVAHSIPSRYS